MKIKILFIDDDKAAIRYYLEELSEHFEVMHCRNPDQAVEVLEREGDSFSLIILDSAFPPGKRYADAETEEGLVTGSFLFKDIRKIRPTTPVLILTNFGGLEWIKRECVSPNVRQVRKLDLMSVGLVSVIQEMLK